ncbi:phage DNA transposition domain protein, partial [Escherichia coli FRIK1997]
YIIGFP